MEREGKGLVMTPRPNLLLIVTDQQHEAPVYESDELADFRREHLAGLERLRQNGVSFRHHYPMSAACAPAAVPAATTLDGGGFTTPRGAGGSRHMANVAVKAKKHAKPAKGKKHHRGVLDVPKAVEAQMAEGRAARESVPLEAHGEWGPSTGVRTRSRSWRGRTRRAFPSWCRSATAA